MGLDGTGAGEEGAARVGRPERGAVSIVVVIRISTWRLEFISLENCEILIYMDGSLEASRATMSGIFRPWSDLLATCHL